MSIEDAIAEIKAIAEADKIKREKEKRRETHKSKTCATCAEWDPDDCPHPDWGGCSAECYDTWDQTIWTPPKHYCAAYKPKVEG